MKNIKKLLTSIKDKIDLFIIKRTDVKSLYLVIGDVNYWDYPDFSDIYFLAGEFTNGKELSDIQLDYLTDTYPDLAYELAMDRVCG